MTDDEAEALAAYEEAVTAEKAAEIEAEAAYNRSCAAQNNLRNAINDRVSAHDEMEESNAK